MSGLVQVDPRVNNEAKLALAALLGSTMAQLKEIDRSIVGSSSNIQSKLDINRVLGAINAPASAPSPVPVPAPALTISQPDLQFTPAPVPAAPVSPDSTTPEDPNQLVFDFNKPITPETINGKLDTIIDKLNRILELLRA